ncbi:hypothetical protein LXA43DRAFT_1007786 [Ganoderma leucocontextum]|nr:hypothetical protein LXA43DRAFT_1007786 [Ganoderma leucocontextum]
MAHFSPCYPDCRSLAGPDSVRLGGHLCNHKHGRGTERRTTQLGAKRVGPLRPDIKPRPCLFTRPTLRPPPACSALFKYDGSGRWMRDTLYMAFQASVTSRSADGILVACYLQYYASPRGWGCRWLYSSHNTQVPSPRTFLSLQPSAICLYGRTQFLLRFAPYLLTFWYLHLASRGWPPDMSQVIRHVRSWTSLPSGLRKGGHRKGFSLIDKYRNDEDTVQWEMVAVSSLKLDFAVNVQPLAPLWYLANSPLEQSLLSPRSPPAAPMYSDMKLPFEVWDDIFKYVDDGYDIHSLARVCRGLRDVSREAKGDHAILTRRYRTLKLMSLKPILDFLDLTSSSPRVGLAVLDLTIAIRSELDRDTVAGLIQLLGAVQNLKRLSLQIQDDSDSWASRTILRAAHLPRLCAFSASLLFTPDVARFIQAHRRVADLSLTHHDPEASGTLAPGREVLPPSLHSLACGLRALQRFRPAPTLTHLHVLVHIPQTLESVCALLGRQLVSLRLGVLERFPDLHTSPCPWSTYDILASFPRLRFIEIHMFEPDFVPQPIHWQQKRDKTLELGRSADGPLTVAWVLEEEAWVDHRESVRQLFQGAAAAVLQEWAPHVERVVFGDAGVLDTSVRLDQDGDVEVEVLGKGDLLGEDHWRKV